MGIMKKYLPQEKKKALNMAFQLIIISSIVDIST